MTVGGVVGLAATVPRETLAATDSGAAAEESGMDEKGTAEAGPGALDRGLENNIGDDVADTGDKDWAAGPTDCDRAWLPIVITAPTSTPTVMLRAPAIRAIPIRVGNAALHPPILVTVSLPLWHTGTVL